MSTKEVPFCMAYFASSRMRSLAAASAGGGQKVGRGSVGPKNAQRCGDGAAAIIQRDTQAQKERATNSSIE
jgi:hypothetical protein